LTLKNLDPKTLGPEKNKLQMTSSKHWQIFLDSPKMGITESYQTYF